MPDSLLLRTHARHVRGRFAYASARRAFPGDAAQLRQLRRWLSGLLPDAPARYDAIMVAVELATNAVKHTASGRGGIFTVEITWHAELAALRIAVSDGGAPPRSRACASPEVLGENGRGLQVVRALAARSGAYGGRCGGLTWADIPWSEFASWNGRGGIAGGVGA